MRTPFAFLLVVSFASVARADDAIPPEILNQIKAATVFVKVKGIGVAATGSGFLIKVDGDSGLLVTNEHVIAPPSNKGKSGPVKIEVVFHSSRKIEMVYPAEVVAADEERDLAVLRIRNARDLPKPINMAEKLELAETMAVYMFGFPFGEALSVTKGNPAITVGKGNISSLRENEKGEIARIQIDGALNPGNSGGPVVDSKGRLVGVAVSKIRNANIGMAIPPRELDDMFNGNVGEVTMRPIRIESGIADVDVRVQFLDPLNRIAEASVLVVRTSTLKAPLRPDKDGKYAPLPGAETVVLKIENQLGAGRITLKSEEKAPVLFTLQPVFRKGDKTQVHGQPTAPFRVDFAATLTKVDPPIVPKTKVEGPSSLAELRLSSASIGTGRAPACMSWADDTKSFYHLDGLGVVRRVSYPDLKEEAALETGKKCSWISPSSLGLVLTVAESQEAWLLDAKTLQPIKKIAIGDAKRVVSSPKLQHAFAVEPNPAGDALSVLDLNAGKVVKQYRASDVKAPAGSGFNHPVVSADGKHLYATGGIEMLLRYRLNGDEVVYEDQTGRIIQGRFEGLCLSFDGEQVCAPSGGGNYPLEGSERIPYCTHVYASGDLKKPLLSLKSGAYPLAVGLDLKSGMIYAQSYQHNLIVFDSKGTKLKEYRFDPKQISETRQFLVHPDGRKLVALSSGGFGKNESSKVWAIEVPAK